ncbi:hypothetical protein AVEN_138953-1 [Araneus ventricosus]|uniref:Uncharacterized protein n=1 Tax=Araneus ventricosus TaxID=182803 RepID=A0A4Y2MQX9_ARAVE|nr:hypothetical protein AVEN_138953-1 [Araneus ventricosus]
MTSGSYLHNVASKFKPEAEDWNAEDIWAGGKESRSVWGGLAHDEPLKRYCRTYFVINVGNELFHVVWTPFQEAASTTENILWKNTLS